MAWFRKKKVYEEELVDYTNIDTDTRVRLLQQQTEKLQKSTNKKEVAIQEPVKFIDAVDLGQGYRTKGNKKGMYKNIHEVLKELSTNIIVNSIITTRANQVARYCVPAKEREDSIGFEVVPKDIKKDLSTHDVANIEYIEDFIKNTGQTLDPTRDSFRQIAKKWVRDLLTYDQLNTELVYEDDLDSPLYKFVAVDASTIYHAVDPKTYKTPKGKNANIYVQVLEDGIVYEKFKKHEMIFETMNPRTDIHSRMYGLSPLEVAMSHVGYHQLTENFNNKYFSQGGTTMGLLHIKTGENSTSRALEDFRRDWQQKFTGVNGSWKVPVVTADDVKYINMNQSSRDMEFEKWLNYLINVLCANFGIDPAEINFPNRGGATGSKGNSLQESSKKETSQLSKDRGLSPILHFIEDVVNRNIMPHLCGGKYLFRFTGDSLEKEIQQVELLMKEVETYKTLNEARAEKGLDPIEGGDVILSAFHIQRIGQLYQKEQMDRQMQMQEAQMMLSNTGETENEPTVSDNDNGEVSSTESKDNSNEVQELQEGMTGKSKADGIKKDGQLRDTKSANGFKEGGKQDN